MAQEFTINSTAIESKINQLLPSQGGFGAGVDFSASTMVIPIVDLTETAEGSDVRADLQTALSFKTTTTFNVTATTTTFLTTTGYYRVFGAMSSLNGQNSGIVKMMISDGTSDKIILNGKVICQNTGVGVFPIYPFDFVVYIPAGHSLKATTSDTNLVVAGCFRQIADIDGNLTDP